MAGVHAAFGEVDIDPCAHPLSPVAARRRILPGEGGDGLVDDWSGRLAFVNPPFSALLKWLRRAHEQWLDGKVETVVCLVPVRTDSAWFHDTLSADADIFLLKGRVRFLSPQGHRQPTSFSLMLLTLGATAEQKERYADLVAGFWLARGAAPEDRLVAGLDQAPPKGPAAGPAVEGRPDPPFPRPSRPNPPRARRCVGDAFRAERSPSVSISPGRSRRPRPRSASSTRPRAWPARRPSGLRPGSPA